MKTKKLLKRLQKVVDRYPNHCQDELVSISRDLLEDTISKIEELKKENKKLKKVCEANRELLRDPR